MEETKDQTRGYTIFRTIIYVSVLMEFFEYAIDPETLDHWNGILAELHDRMKRWWIYQDGNLVISKAATFIMVCITSIGTRNKKNLEFDARRTARRREKLPVQRHQLRRCEPFKAREPHTAQVHPQPDRPAWLLPLQRQEAPTDTATPHDGVPAPVRAIARAEARPRPI